MGNILRWRAARCTHRRPTFPSSNPPPRSRRKQQPGSPDCRGARHLPKPRPLPQWGSCSGSSAHGSVFHSVLCCIATNVEKRQQTLTSVLREMRSWHDDGRWLRRDNIPHQAWETCPGVEDLPLMIGIEAGRGRHEKVRLLAEQLQNVHGCLHRSPRVCCCRCQCGPCFIFGSVCL